MVDNSHLDFRLKIYILELDTITIETSATPSSLLATTVTAAAAVDDFVPVTDYVIRTIDSFDVSHNNINYRAEGNANIVLALPQRCQVLRLPKKSKSQQNICRSTANECSQNERIFYVYKYIDCVSKLFGQNISSRPILVRIEFCNVDAFNIWLYNHRPLHRIQSTSSVSTTVKQDEFDFDYGLLYHDACSLNINLESTTRWFQTNSDNVLFAIEIKPKQGWNIFALPDWILQLFGISHVLQHKCRFCAMQHLKVNERQVKQLSKYCPLDLFSGETARMNKSIRNLIDAPQNNFRVFCNGQLVYSDDVDNQDHVLHAVLSPLFRNKSNIVNDFISLLVNILLYDFQEGFNPFLSVDVSSHQMNDQINTTAIEEKCGTKCIVFNSSSLPKRSILNHVLNLQLLAKRTIPYIAQKYIENSHKWKKLTKNEQWSHSHVSKLCQKLNRTNHSPDNVIDYEYLKYKCNLDDEEIYEIGATALDSSIMLTFQSVDQQTNLGYPLIKLNDQQYIINTSVFDLDPKLYPCHFTKYVKKTRDSYIAYQQFFGNKTL